MIKIKNLTKRFDDQIIFENLNINIQGNGIVYIQSESGRGKTTLLNIISGIDKNYTGECYVNNKVSNIGCLGSEIFYLRQGNNNLIEASVISNMEIFISNYKDESKLRENIDHTLRKVGLSEKKNILVKYLSGGEQKRLSLAMALLSEAPIILLDEPTSNIDKDSLNQILECIKEISKNKLVLFVTHDISIIQKGDNHIDLSFSDYNFKNKNTINNKLSLNNKSNKNINFKITKYNLKRDITGRLLRILLLLLTFIIFINTSITFFNSETKNANKIINYYKDDYFLLTEDYDFLRKNTMNTFVSKEKYYEFKKQGVGIPALVLHSNISLGVKGDYSKVVMLNDKLEDEQVIISDYIFNNNNPDETLEFNNLLYWDIDLYQYYEVIDVIETNYENRIESIVGPGIKDEYINYNFSFIQVSSKVFEFIIDGEEINFSYSFVSKHEDKSIVATNDMFLWNVQMRNVADFYHNSYLYKYVLIILTIFSIIFSLEYIKQISRNEIEDTSSTISILRVQGFDLNLISRSYVIDSLINIIISFVVAIFSSWGILTLIESIIREKEFLVFDYPFSFYNINYSSLFSITFLLLLIIIFSTIITRYIIKKEL